MYQVFRLYAMAEQTISVKNDDGMAWLPGNFIHSAGKNWQKLQHNKIKNEIKVKEIKAKKTLLKSGQLLSIFEYLFQLFAGSQA